MMIFSSRIPTQEEYEQYPIINITSDEPWDPSKLFDDLSDFLYKGGDDDDNDDAQALSNKVSNDSQSMPCDESNKDSDDNLKISPPEDEEDHFQDTHKHQSNHTNSATARSNSTLNELQNCSNGTCDASQDEQINPNEVDIFSKLSTQI